MASPVHRYLFSPPSSPPAIQGSHSPLLEPLESFHAINRLLSPSPSSFNRHSHSHGNDPSSGGGFLPGPQLDAKKQTPTISHQAGPGGFATSTQTYPSRVVSPVPVSASSVMVTGYALPPFPPSSTSSYQPRQQPTTSRRNSFSTPYAPLQQQPASVPTREYMLPLPSTHRRPSVAVPTSTSVRSGVLSLLVHGRKSVLGLTRIRTLLVALVGLACLLLLVRSTTVPLLAAVAPTTRYQDFEKLSLVGGKKVRVTDHHGAPRTLLYSKIAQESHGMAIAPPERVSRPTHHHHHHHHQVPPLTPAQEVLALQSYLLASPHHALPPNTRPLEPLDPMTLVGFQATGGGWKELERDVEPLVVYSFSKTWTRPVLELLSLYALDPQPVVFSVEGRADAPVLAETLARLVPSRSPAAASEAVITIAGKPINGYAQLEKLHRAGKLHGMLERAGAVVDGLRRKEEGERARRGRLVKRLKHAQIKVVRGDQDGEDEAE